MADASRFKNNQFGKAVPSIPVKDCSAALQFYCGILGFSKDFDDAVLHREKTLFAGISRGDCELTLNQHDEQDYKLTIGCAVGDVDLLHEEYVARGVKVLTPPRDEPWGERVMIIEDLYGHNLVFSTPKTSNS